MSPEAKVMEALSGEKVEYVATLPCEKIRNLLCMLPSHFKEIKLTREECGIGICAGIYLAGGKAAMIIQSAGLGNSINAIASLPQAYGLAVPTLHRCNYQYNLLRNLYES